MGIAQPIVEEPVVEAPQPSAEPVAEPVEQPSPEAPEGAGEGQPAAGGEGFDPSALSDDAWDYLLEHAPKEKLESSEFIRERERRAEQRAETRWREQQEARNSVQQGRDGLIQLADQAEAWVRQVATELTNDYQLLDAFSDPERYDPEKVRQVAAQIKQKVDGPTLQQALSVIQAGAVQKAEIAAGQFRITALAEAGRDLLNEKAPLTEDDQKRLADARYRDAQTGQIGYHTSAEIVKILLERKDQEAYQRGLQKGLKDKQAQAELLEKAANLTAVRNGVAPKIDGAPGGGASSLADAERAYNTSPSEANRRALREWYARTPGYESMIS